MRYSLASRLGRPYDGSFRRGRTPHEELDHHLHNPNRGIQLGLYVIQIRRASTGQDPAVFQVFGLMWCPGVAGLHNQLLAALIERIPHLPQAARLPFRLLFLATVGVLGSCIFALGEELGWRGFLVPQLAKVTSYVRVSLISGAVWALWHYPVILFANYRGVGPLWCSVACFTVMVLGLSFLFAWMRLKSGSVWTGVLLHGSHNIFVQAFFDSQTRSARVTGLWTTEFGAGLALIAVVISIIFYSKRGELPAGGLSERSQPGV